MFEKFKKKVIRETMDDVKDAVKTEMAKNSDEIIEDVVTAAIIVGGALILLKMLPTRTNSHLYIHMR